MRFEVRLLVFRTDFSLWYPIRFQKTPEIFFIADNHDLFEFPGITVSKTRNLLTGADTASNHRLLNRRIIGMNFLFSAKEHCKSPDLLDVRINALPDCTKSQQTR